LKRDFIKRKSPLFRVIQIAVFLAIFYFLGRNLVLNWRELVSYRWRPDISFLALSLLLTVGGGLLVALGWSFILRSMGQMVPHPRTLRIYYLSELAKYLPGKIWTAVGRVFLLEKEGVPKVVTIASVGTMLIVLTVSGVLVVLLTMPLWPSRELAGGAKFLYLLVLLPAGLILLHPRIFDPVLNWFLRKVEHITLPVRLKYGNILLLVGYWCGLWLIKGVATFYLLRAIYRQPLPAYSWLIFPGVMAISWVVGTLSPFTPAGLGIAELSLVVLLGSLFGMEAGFATAFAILSRVWAIITELICVALTCRLK
jgi:hypothetical protein